MEHYNGTYEVSLTLPDCERNGQGENNDPIGAVHSFQSQASQWDLWVYIVRQESHPHRAWRVDMADHKVTEITNEEE